MDLNRPSRIDELFHQAADLSPAERSAFLERACAGDEELRQELESLLAADVTQDGFLRAAVDQAIEQLPTTAKESSEPIGQRVGRYFITGLLGQGGMGAVYRAVRTDDFRMQVAIKFLKHGTDTEAALSRFRSERQILAELQHANIARLLDGGATETGLPYFVMEYVDGTPLLDYAAPLPIRKRLELFRSICQAVHYAHEHRVVHRDIKPANILVTRDGTPKLLDFGIAKLVDPTAEGNTGATLTMAGVRLMTPDYASPEQVRGEPITAATDIYSLGVVLYELLTGQRAHQVETCSPSEIEKEICTREPRKPSAVANHLDPDLDNVVLKALRKEPERRYRSVQELADDLDCYLHDLPVKARKESLLYRGRKFLKRKRGIIGAATAGAGLVLALVAIPRLYEPESTKLRFIAVLPLENVSGDKEQDYFSEGITDGLINDLARIRALRVLSYSSVMAYKGVHRSVRDIARKLGVRTVAEGSVLRAGNRVRISLRLVDAPNDQAIWNGNYEGELRDILIVQRDVAEVITSKMHVTLTPQEQAHLSHPGTVDLAAYDAYLKGRHQYLTAFTQESMQKAISQFQQAIARDPNYAPAYAGLAECYSMASGRFYPPVEMMPKAKAAALKAIDVDERLGGAHAVLAFIRSVYDYDRHEAEKGFKRAIELEPSNADARLWYAEHLAGTDRPDKAVAQLQKAHELDPVSPGLNGYVGLLLYYSHRYNELIQQMRELAAIYPDLPEAHYFLGLAYEQKGQCTNAMAELERPGVVFESSRATLGHTYAICGRTADARRILEQVTFSSSREYIAPYTIALLCAALGDKEQAFSWLRKSVDEHSEDVALVSADPRLINLHSDPRFADIRHRVGLGN